MAGNRQLTPNEENMEILNRYGGSSNVITISRVKGGLKEEIVRQALDLIQTRHPRLNSRIVASLDSYFFDFGTIKIPLRVVYKQSSEESQEIILEELNQVIESDKCLIRVVLIIFPDKELNYLITTLHHAISDGLSSVALHSDILTYCHKIVANAIEENIIILPAIPDIQELMPKSMQGKIASIKKILFLLKFQLKLSLFRPKTLQFDKFVPGELRRCNLVQRKLNKEITTQLVELCREKGTTVQGALCAAMMLAVSRDIRNKTDNKGNLCLSCCSYLSLRKRLKPEVDRENLGMLISAIISLHSLGTKISFWDLAWDVRQKLKFSLESNDIFSVLLVLRKMVEFFLSRPNEAAVTVSVSNIGQLDMSSYYGSFQLEEISFLYTEAVLAGIFNAAVTTFQDTMILNFMFSEPSISKERIEILVQDTIYCIIDACKKDD
jgi:Alcohol acetyltransferase